MTVVQARGTANKAKKHPPILFGGRLLRLEVGPQRRTFSAHEDMLCMQSTIFKDRFQTERKEVEGDCIICDEGLDAVVNSLTYCKACGNNLHRDCMIQWFNTNSTCPACHANWVKSPFVEAASLEDVDADGFDVYVQWLYGHSIPTYAADKEDMRVRCKRLVKAHVVGDFVCDEEFLKAVRSEIIKDSLQWGNDINTHALDTAYTMTTGPCSLRRFMIDMYVLHGNRGSWLSKIKKLPRAALVDLVTSSLDKAKLQDDREVWSFMAVAGCIEQEGGDAGSSEGQEEQA